MPRKKQLKISEQHLLDLIYYARRYCDNRSTYAPSSFNRIYVHLRSEYPEIFRQDLFDDTLKDDGKYWPYAQDGQYNPETNNFDARIKDKFI